MNICLYRVTGYGILEHEIRIKLVSIWGTPRIHRNRKGVERGTEGYHRLEGHGLGKALNWLFIVVSVKIMTCSQASI